MNDMSHTIVPKSDQINADDLIAGPKTITITRVTVAVSGEQPVRIYYQGEDGEKKPWLPCKGMRRLLIFLWGKDGDAYVGRSLTVFRDPNVLWAGAKTGGIRISHASHITEEVVVPIAESRKARKPVLVKPLVVTDAKQSTTTANKADTTPPTSIDVNAIIAAYSTCDVAGFDRLENERSVYWRGLSTEKQKLIKQAVESAKAALSDGLPT